MAKIISDRALLKKIYKVHYSKFCDFDVDNPVRTTKNFVPVDMERVGRDLGINPGLVFGRLYYHLDKKYGYKQPDGALVPLFVLRMGEDRHLINFPLLEGVLADLEGAHWRFMLPIAVSAVALIISLAGVIWSS